MNRSAGVGVGWSWGKREGERAGEKEGGRRGKEISVRSNNSTPSIEFRLAAVGVRQEGGELLRVSE